MAAFHADSLSVTDSMTMEFQCNSIVLSMAKKTRPAGDGGQISITLPPEAIEMIEEGLIPFGLYGKKRATIAAALIVEALRRPDVQRNIEVGRKKAKGAAT